MCIYDAVIFDLDGTLTDSKPGIFASTRHALEKMGLAVPDEAVLQKFLGPPLAESFMCYCGMDERQAALATDYYRETYNPEGWKNNAVYPHIRALLHALRARGVFLAVATGKPLGNAEKILKYFDLLQYFDAVSGPALTDLHADKAALIRKVLPAGRHAVMVGDTAGDVIGAREAGIDSIAALYGYGAKEETLAAGPVHAVPDTEALCRLLCPDMPKARGYFVTFEGVDGCGKSTQIAAIEKKLSQFGYITRRTREPGGCPIAEEIRRIVLAKEDGGMCAETEALLFAAARAQHVKEVILPSVAQGRIVLCDRFVDSSLVYQGSARGLSQEWIREINRSALQEGVPDATVYLRMPHAEALRRRLTASDPDRIEQMGDSFQAQTEAGYEALLQENPHRFLPVNAAKAPEDVTEEAFRLLFSRMIKEGVL